MHIEQKPLVATYDYVNTKRAMTQGQSLVHACDGDTLLAMDSMGDDGQLLDFVRPTEGFVISMDALVCPITNESRYGAHLFMDYLLEPEVAGKNASWVWFLSGVVPASWKYTDPFALTIKPTDEELARSEHLEDLGEFSRAYTDAWTEVKAS